MTGNRQIQVGDYFAALRAHRRQIAVLAVLTMVLAFGLSFAFPKKYTSRSLVQVEGQVLPPGYVKPIVTERVGQRVAALQQRVLARARLVPMLEKLGLADGNPSEELLERVRQNLTLTPAEPGSNPSSLSANKKKFTDRDDIPGFYIDFTWDNAGQAQEACAAITSMLLDENLKARQQAGQSTTDFLARQLEQAKGNLDSLDNELATFKKQHLGHLPGDIENNLKILTGLDSQLDANTQLLARAQQEKSFAESLLTQQLAVWKTTQQFSNLPSLREQLSALENQLIGLQARYTEDHPDVIKLKGDIAEVKSKLQEMRQPDKKKAAEDDPGAKADPTAKMEPPEIISLRERVHQQEGLIDRATAEQTKLKEQIESYQARLALSPDVEEQYKKLTRDTETAHASYDNLLANKTSAEMQTEMEREQQGEQIKLLEPASLPLSPSFPVRWMFAVGGLLLGLATGIGWLVVRELADQSIRSEHDVADLLNLPTLASMPWAGNSR